MKRACATCGTPLPARTGRGRPATYCSTTCRESASTRHSYNKHGRTRKRPCTQCGTPLATTQQSSQATLLCHTCRAANRIVLFGPDPTQHERIRRRLAQRERRRNGTVVSPGSHHKRARKYGVEYQYVDKRRVFARDQWRCGICRRKVDRRLKWPHPRAATLDHIIPMARGGGHTYTNTQCSHWECNHLKQAGGEGEQLALIG